MNLSDKNLEKIKFSTLEIFGHCWIAGGAIADFFLDKKPNDIDMNAIKFMSGNNPLLATSPVTFATPKGPDKLLTSPLPEIRCQICIDVHLHRNNVSLIE